MTIGLRAANKTGFLGKLSGFNVWSYAMIAEEILRMSYGCGHEAGDAKAWHKVRHGLKKRVAVEWSRTCNDRKGDSFIVTVIFLGPFCPRGIGAMRLSLCEAPICETRS